jgi:hypothetical protein
MLKKKTLFNWRLKTPVVFIIFNRPDTTKKVFERIREAKPTKLFVIADGPRKGHPEDKEKCDAARAIINSIDWDCKIFKNYSNVNMGCGKRPASGLDWVFEKVKEAIILEDDCLPHPSFFRYCEELLERYRENKRIMSIAGTNVQFGRNKTMHSYYFSRYFHGWGWATWKRAWQHFDFDMKLWPNVKDNKLLRKVLEGNRAVKCWTKLFQSLKGRKDIWDYQFAFAHWVHNGLCIVPNINLVSNIGFGKEATHTTYEKSPYTNINTEVMTFPLKYPPSVVRNVEADKFEQNTYHDPTLAIRVKRKIKRILGI